MKKNGFTLIELVVVISIIGLLTTMTMIFGANRIQDLRYRSGKEIFVHEFETLRAEAMRSNYAYGKKYDTMLLTIQSGNSVLSYSYMHGPETTEAYTTRDEHNLIVENIMIDGEPSNTANIRLSPYRLDCILGDSDTEKKKLSFMLLIPIIKKYYCFELPAESCKLKEVACENIDL